MKEIYFCPFKLLIIILSYIIKAWNMNLYNYVKQIKKNKKQKTMNL